MKRTFLLLSAVCLLVSLGVSAAAQTAGPPRVLLFEREELRPGKFDEHLRESNNFARTLAFAKKAGEHSYVRLGMSPVAGNYNEVLYAYPFDSMEQWAQSQRDIERWMTTPGPVKAFYDAAAGPPRQGEDLHTSVHSMVGVYQPALSYNPRPSLARARYLSVATFHVRVGHFPDFMRLAAMYIEAAKKVRGERHWAAYQLVGGAPDGTFLMLTSMESLAELDAQMAASGDFMKVMGERLDDFEKLVAATVESVNTTIYEINPKMSNPPDEFVAADPQFWSQELPAAAPATRTASVRARRK